MNDLFFRIKSLSAASLETVQMLQLPCLDSSENIVLWLVTNLCWGTISRICVELSRDILHTLGHVWQRLAPHHLWHHTAFKRGYLKRWPAYYTSLQHHDLPEALLMVLVAGTFTFLACTQTLMTGSFVGCLFVLLHALKQLGITILRVFKVEWAINTDTMHLTTPLTEPPSIWRVNRSYHLRHHFGDPMAYFGVNFSVLDKILKTALSLKGRVVGYANPLGHLSKPLTQELIRAGARVVPHGEPLDFKQVCILVIDISRLRDICPEGIIQQMENFLETVHTDEEIVTKEIWLIVSHVENAIAWASLDAIYQRYLSDWLTRRRLNAPCILRKIVIGDYRGRHPGHAQVAHNIVGQVKRDMRNIVVKVPFWTHLIQPVKEWIVSTYFCLNSQ